jgi:hypothetical protein
MRAFALALLVLGCTKSPPDKPPPPAAHAESPQAVVRLGDPITAATVELGDVARSPRKYEGQALSTSGTVTAVCQNMGCWMELRDEAGDARVRMHGHAFFVPKSASGRHARIQATVVPSADEKECDEKAPSDGKLAHVELDATGVELD